MAIYLIPQTAILGAILLTVYMGGAVPTHIHAGSGLFPIFFSFTFGVLVWLGLYLRDRNWKNLVHGRDMQKKVAYAPLPTVIGAQCSIATTEFLNRQDPEYASSSVTSSRMTQFMPDGGTG